MLKERLEREVLPHFSTRRLPNAQALMRRLYQTPAMSINQVAAMLDLKHNTASALVTDFVKHGVLKELTGKKRNRVYCFEKYLLIFARKEAGATWMEESEL